MKETFVRVRDQEIAVRLVNGFIRYSKSSVVSLMEQDGFDAGSVDQELPRKDFLTRKEVYGYMKSQYPSKEYREKFTWLKREVEPLIRKTMKKVKEGTRLRIINGLVVREHPTIEGLFSLTDAWKASKNMFESEEKWKARRPIIWQRDFKGKIKNLKKEISKSDATSLLENPLILSKPGRYGGTYAHPRLLIAYTEWVHVKLHNKVLKVFEDYEEGVLQTKEQHDRRAKGTQTREDRKVSFQKFKESVTRVGGNTPNCTSKLLNGVFGKTKTQKMREDHINEPFRDNITELEHLKITMAETMARSNFIMDKVRGQIAAETSCSRAGNTIRELYVLRELESTGKIPAGSYLKEMMQKITQDS